MRSRCRIESVIGGACEAFFDRGEEVHIVVLACGNSAERLRLVLLKVGGA